MLKRIRYRAYPTKSQDHYFQKVFGTCRFVYNWGLDLKIKSYQESKANNDPKPKSLSIYDISALLTAKKKDPEFEWLSEVPSISLIHSLNNLDLAFKQFFRKGGAGFPQFKSKFKSQKTFAFHQGYRIEHNRLLVPKSGWLKLIMNRPIMDHWKTKTVTVVQEPSGKYYVSIVVDDGLPPVDKIPFDDAGIIGIDVGVINTLSLSDGHRLRLNLDFAREEKRLITAQRDLSKKVKRSNNWAKQKIAVARKYEKIRHKRETLIKQIVYQLVAYLMNCGYCGIALRDYDIKEMTSRDKDVVKDDTGIAKKGERKKRKQLNKTVLNGAMGMLCQSIKQKCLENGLHVLEMDADEEKTTAKCFVCGSEDVTINIRTRILTCLHCAHEDDIDMNAAKNTKRYCIENQDTVETLI